MNLQYRLSYVIIIFFCYVTATVPVVIPVVTVTAVFIMIVTVTVIIIIICCILKAVRKPRTVPLHNIQIELPSVDPEADGKDKEV